MTRPRFRFFGSAVLLLTLPAFGSAAWGSDTKDVKPSTPATAEPSASQPSTAQPAEKMTSQTRLLVIRSLQSERVFAKITLPQGKTGIKIKNGVVSPSEMAIAQQVADSGPAARPGDRCVISNVDIKDNKIIVEINGGPKKSQKWYQHIQIGGGTAGTNVPGPVSPQSLDAHGTSVTLEFDKYVPELNGDQVRSLLAPVFDFQALTQVEAYEKTLPPKVQEAIKNHQVLVGMDKEMVVYAKGKAPRKIRDKDEQGQNYEEWIYGTPPEEVEFVRFKGDEVSRLEIMSIDGQKIVKTEREVELPSKETEVAEQKPAPKPAYVPTLRRPGEEVGYPQPDDSTHRTPRPQDQQIPNDGSPNPDTTGMPVPGPGGTVPPPH